MNQVQPIVSYSLDQAVEDGVLIVRGRTKHKVLVVTQAVNAELSEAEQAKLFYDFWRWQAETEPELPEEDRLFSKTAKNGKTVWVIDDQTAVTLLYPSDY